MQIAAVYFILFLSFSQSVRAIDQSDYDHLVGRLAFSPSAPVKGLEGWRLMSREEAVDAVLDSVDVALAVVPGEWVETPRLREKKRLRFKDSELELAYQRSLNQERFANRRMLKKWWIDQIASGHSPVAERLLLFWHNVWTTELSGLTKPQLLWWQHVTFREHLLGNYRVFLNSMVRDPAVLDYLDNDKSRRGRTNENFARELLELFTLGEGHYTEQDIKELSRAFTGAGVDRAGNYRFSKRQHDSEMKTVFGEHSKLAPDEVVELLLRQSRSASYLVERFWKEFVSADPDAVTVEKMANDFRRSGFELRPLLRAVLLSDDFWMDRNRKQMIQSPVEYVFDLHWRSGTPISKDTKILFFLKSMGQDPFDPPDVAGWPNGKGWINSSGLLARNAYLNRVFKGSAKSKRKHFTSYIK